MPELFSVVPPAVALARLWEHLSGPLPAEDIALADAVTRVLARPLVASEPLPAFARSAMDGYAVRAHDTYGASESLPAYLTVVGEAPMGRAPDVVLAAGQAALIHTGGMLPEGADAVVMVERTQPAAGRDIEVLRPVAPGENVLQPGEDVRPGDALLPAGHILRAQDLGGLAALGIVRVPVARRPQVALLATGDEVVPPEASPQPGQVRDVNSYALAGLVRRAGGEPLFAGIAPDRFEELAARAGAALAAADALVVSAGSSVSVRDMTAEVIAGLGPPGVLVHGVSLKPGKPTILAVCAGRPVFGLPGNPVSALVVAGLFLAPTLWRLQGAEPPARPALRARLARNVASAAGREDYLPVRIEQREGEPWADPIFGKSNLIYTLVRATGLLRIPLDAGGLVAGEWVDVTPF
jgi:molybdopterin molybdotransferase